MNFLKKDKAIVLFYKSLNNIGGAENLLIREYEYFENIGFYPIIFTYENKILNKSYKVVKIKNIIDLVFQIKKIKPHKIICSSGHIDIYLASIVGVFSYFLHIHQPSLLSFNETDKFAFNNLKKLKKAFIKNKQLLRNIRIFKKLKKRITVLNKILITLRFFFSYLSIRKAQKVFVLSSFSAQEKQALYNKPAISIRGAIQKINKLETNYKKDDNKNINLVIVSRIDINKRISKVIRAIKKSNKKINLDIYGVGEYSSHLKRLINILNLDDRIKLKGFLEERNKTEIINQYDYFVCVDMADFRISCFEALNSKTPVILTKESFPNEDFDNLNCFNYTDVDIKSLINTFNNLKYKNNLMIDWSSVEIKLKKLIWYNYFEKLNEHITKD
ncbi:glycosyltransferase [Candidatus Pelagibacter communis]|uniref:glycosyltransferase n=1 Tax=Pelagibacter ubique TaxID=198252 RepID=UPI00094C1B95|nr:glycosyltransferase [Candidatus Pelagibacter ubique]